MVCLCVSVITHTVQILIPGEVGAIWSPDGRCRIVHGPLRTFLWRSTFRLLTPYSADQNQYLAVR